MTQRGTTVITSGRIVRPEGILEGAAVVVEDGRIVAVGRDVQARGAQLVDAGGLYVIPGLVDIHVHGGAGYDTMDATPEALASMAQFFAAHGVTSFLPTTVTASHEQTLAAVANAARCQERSTGGAHVLGVHLEGPYISPKHPGAQPVEHIRPAAAAEYEELFRHGNVRLISLAPEVAENRALIGYARARGAAVAVGHSDAGYDQVLEAVELGVTQACHIFNGMVGLHHREPGTAGAALTCDAIYAQAIVDFIHLHPAIVKLLVRAKGVARTVLITDAMRAAGLPDGEYELGGQPVTVADGAARLVRGGNLAGSTLTLDRALRNAISAADLPLAEALPMATSVPAESIMLAGAVGTLAPGAYADVVLLDDALEVQMTMVQGDVVYRR